MAVEMGAATVPSGTGATLLFRLPASQCNVTVYNLAAPTVWLGASPSVTSANGVQCHSIPTSFFTYVGNAGTGIYGTTGSTAATSVATVQYILVTNF
jgi:hypothetical protein